MRETAAQKIDRLSVPEPNSGCWLWMGSLSQSGYPQVWLDNHPRSAHRLSWALVNGPIPDGMFICHKCDVPVCVNPDHLFAGTQAANMADKAHKGRSADRHGDKHPCRKLSEAEIPEIFRLRRLGLRQWQLGEIFGVGQDQISRILARKAWVKSVTA